jgi:hypothetical protein
VGGVIPRTRAANTRLYKETGTGDKEEHTHTQRGTPQHTITPNKERADVDTTGRADDPQMEVTGRRRRDLTGGEQVSIKHHAVDGLPHRPQEGEDHRVALG